jgi:large subunit ribosomal protein L15
MELHQLCRPAYGSNKKRKRVGRGESSGSGKTAGRGGKGQTARTGKGKPRAGFEGGQMPMYRRMPKRGFKNIFAIPSAVVNLDALERVFAEGSRVDLESARAMGLATRTDEKLRVLARGELTKKLVVCADHISGAAREKIVAVGGQVVDKSA